MRNICTFASAIKYAAYFSILTGTSASFGHVVLADQAALANTSYRATLRVGHGCEGSPITAVRVIIPEGFRGAKPMPHAGWVLSTKVGKLSKPYDDHGKTITEGLQEVTWTASGKDNWLQDDWYDEFVLRGTLAVKGGAMWFKVLQTCEKGSIDWAEVPASGTSTKGLKFPAALLEVIDSGTAGHAH